MSSHMSVINEAGNILTVTAHPVTDLAMRPYIEYRLEERSPLGDFLGYCAMGSHEFVLQAMLDRTRVV